MSKQDIEKRLGFAAQGVKAKFGRFSTEFGFLANQIKNQPDLAKKNIIVLAKKMGKEVDITRAEFEQLMQYAAKLGMETQVANAHDDVRPGFSRTGAKAKFVRIVTTPQGRYTTNLDKNTRAPIDGGKGYVMVDPAMYITPKRVRVQGTKGEIEVQAIVEGKEIVGVSAKLVSARPGVKAKMAKRMVVDTITSGNQKHELGYESVMQPVAAGEPPHEWFRPIVRTTNLDTGKSSEKASQPHYTEKSARDWLKNYASSVKPSTDPLYAEYASNREKISKMMTRLAQARNNPELRQKLQAESDKLDARQREVAAQLQKRKSSRPGVKAEMAIRAGNLVKFKYIVAPGDKEFRGKVVRIEGKYAIVDFGITTPAYQEWVQPGQMTRRILVDELVTAARPGVKAKMGFLSRVGYAATALTADPADPKSPEYRKQVSEAKAAAKDAITNYKFMRDKVKERLAALDAYVTNAIKVINSATSAKDIEHYVEQLRIAVKSQSMILGASKSPFSRAGAKAKFGLSPSEMKENQRRIEDNIRNEAGEMRNLSSNMRFIKDEIERLTAEIKNTRDIKRKAQLSLKLDAENKRMKDQVLYLRRARQSIQKNQAEAKSLGITLDAKWSGNFARPGVKAKA